MSLIAEGAAVLTHADLERCADKWVAVKHGAVLLACDRLADVVERLRADHEAADLVFYAAPDLDGMTRFL